MNNTGSDNHYRPFQVVSLKAVCTVFSPHRSGLWCRSRLPESLPLAASWSLLLSRIHRD